MIKKVRYFIFFLLSIFLLSTLFFSPALASDVSDNNSESEEIQSDFSTFPSYDAQTHDLTYEPLWARLHDAMCNDIDNVDVSDLDVYFDLSNGEHLLSDFQDDLFFRYAEDSFVLQNMTFTQQNGKLLSVKLNYVDDISVRATQRTLVKDKIDAIVEQTTDITDDKARVDKIFDLVYAGCEEDRLAVNPHAFDVYGAFGIYNVSHFGGAMALHACLQRFGYEEDYFWDNKPTITLMTKIGDVWKYTDVSTAHAWKDKSYLLSDRTANAPTYSPEALDASTYTPMSIFANNPYLDERNTNSQYFRDQIIAGATSFVLPEEVFVNYRLGTWLYTRRVTLEYPEVGMFYKNGTLQLQDGQLSVSNVQYSVTDAATRTQMLQDYWAARDKIVALANQYESDRTKVICVNNYIASTTTYRSGRTHSGDAYGCLVERQCVCEGFGCAFHDIMRHLGIEDYLFETNTHLQNRVFLDGEYWIVDTTNNSTNSRLLVEDKQPQQARTYIRSDMYITDVSFSMLSDATSYLVNQIAAGKTQIDLAWLHMPVDAALEDMILSRYTQNLEFTFPLELLDVDTLTFTTYNGEVSAANVTYLTRTAAERQAFQTYLDEIIATAQAQNTEMKQFQSVITSFYQKNITTNTNDDAVACALNNSGSIAAITKLCGCALERMGIHYSALKETGAPFYFKTVIDGNERFGIVERGEVRTSTRGWSYYIYNDAPIYALHDEAYAYQPRVSAPLAENAILDDWGTPLLRQVDAPQEMLSAENKNRCIFVSWDSVNLRGARYFLYRREQGTNEWTPLSTMFGTAYLDYNVESGHCYQYFLHVQSRSSSFDSAVISQTYLAAPSITSEQSYSIRENRPLTCLLWNSVDGATSYDVYRSVGTEWQLLGSTTECSLSLITDDGNPIEGAIAVPANQAIYYRVVAKNDTASSLLTAGSTTRVAIPSSVSWQATVNQTTYTAADYPRVKENDTQNYRNGVPATSRKIQVKWNRVGSLTTYDVYRIRLSDGFVRYIGAVAGTRLYDTPGLGTEFYYVVIPHIQPIRLVPKLD